MLTSSRFVPDIMETPEQFGKRIDMARSSSKRAVGVLRALADIGDYGDMTAGEIYELADQASMFPEDAVRDLPEVAAVSREQMVQKMLEPYATYRCERARAPVYAENDANSVTRAANVYSTLADRVGVMPSDIADSQAGRTASNSYVEAMYQFYR